jgi:hypothetical protein
VKVLDNMLLKKDLFMLGTENTGAEARRNRVKIFGDLTNCSENKGDKFLQHILTYDEIWIQYYVPYSSTEWQNPSSPVWKKFKVQASADRIMLILFWDMKDQFLPTIWNWAHQ